LQSEGWGKREEDGGGKGHSSSEELMMKRGGAHGAGRCGARHESEAVRDARGSVGGR